jgi:hypothetical protein
LRTFRSSNLREPILDLTSAFLYETWHGTVALSLTPPRLFMQLRYMADSVTVWKRICVISLPPIRTSRLNYVTTWSFLRLVHVQQCHATGEVRFFHCPRPPLFPRLRSTHDSVTQLEKHCDCNTPPHDPGGVARLVSPSSLPPRIELRPLLRSDARARI